MNKEKKIVPELRFPEFVNDGEWQYLNGDELFEPVSNRDHNSDLPILAISQEHGAIPREMIDYTVIASKESINNYKVVEKGDFIISLRSFQGGIEYSNYKGICSPAYIVLRKKKKLEDIFFKYYFKTDLYIRHLNKNLEGIRDGKMVSYNQFSEILLPYPSIKEQQKIASCLTSLDKLIETHNKKLEALNEHKKGLMQNLFPQEGKKVPKFRFPEFVNEGEWVKKSLEEISIKIQDGTHFSPKSYDTGDFLYITSKNVKNGYIELSSAQFISRMEHESIYKRCDVKQGDVLLTKDGTIGQACVNELLIPFSLLSSVAFIRVKPKFSNYFLYHLLVSQIGQKEIESQIAGQALKRITLTKINNFTFDFPSIQEQQKIASCLSVLDNLIKAQSDKTEQLKEHKKGLIQSLFPII